MNELRLNPQTDDPLRARGALRAGAREALWLTFALGVGTALSGCAMDGADNADSAVGIAVINPIGNTSPPPERPFEGTGDRFLSVGTNPFVMVEHDPLSTFATDADTASYDLFVRDVEAGYLPAPASVRLEDYVNYFEYAYPTAPADAEQPFSIALAAARHPLAEGTALLRVGLQGKAAPASEKKPANLTFLVDVSGSMQSADKLPLVQQVLRQTLDLLQPEDTVSIVSYAGDTSVRLAPTHVADRARIVGVIDHLSAGGATAGASGIELAYAQARAGFLQDGINHVILCTDGDFNVGPSNDAELVELISEERRSGVTLTALGFGTGNLNDAMLERVSNAGNGFYGFISSESQAAAYVHERLLSTMTLIAKDVKVQVELNPDQVLAYRLLGYEDRAIADRDFRNDVVDAGEVGSEHRVTALYELVLAGGSVPDAAGAPPVEAGAPDSSQTELDATELARVRLRYKAVDAGETDPAREVSASLASSAAGTAFEQADPDLAWAYAVAAFAEVLKHSPYARADRLDLIDSVLAAQAERDDDRAAFYRLFQSARGL